MQHCLLCFSWESRQAENCWLCRAASTESAGNPPPEQQCAQTGEAVSVSWEATAEEVADPRSKPEPGHRPGPDVVPVPWFAWLREVCECLLIFLPQACLHHGGSRLVSMHDMW